MNLDEDSWALISFHGLDLVTIITHIDAQIASYLASRSLFGLAALSCAFWTWLSHEYLLPSWPNLLFFSLSHPVRDFVYLSLIYHVWYGLGRGQC